MTLPTHNIEENMCNTEACCNYQTHGMACSNFICRCGCPCQWQIQCSVLILWVSGGISSQSGMYLCELLKVTKCEILLVHGWGR